MESLFRVGGKQVRLGDRRRRDAGQQVPPAAEPHRGGEMPGAGSRCSPPPGEQSAGARDGQMMLALAGGTVVSPWMHPLGPLARGVLLVCGAPSAVHTLASVTLAGVDRATHLACCQALDIK